MLIGKNYTVSADEVEENMISILRTNDEQTLRRELKKKEELSLEAIGAYATAVEAVCEHLLRMCPPIVDLHGAELRSIADDVRPEMSIGELERSRTRLLARLIKLGQDGSAEYETMAKDIRDILKIAASATETLQTQTDGSGDEWNRFTTEVERIAAIGDLQEVRASLRREVQHMNLCMQAMATDSARVISQLRGELTSLRNRAAHDEEMATLDPVTGLRNRRAVELALAERTRQANLFCILMFDINRFKIVNDRYGVETGNQILQQFGKRLLGAIREGDLAARWERDQFLTIVGCPVNIVIARARQIHARVSGTYEAGLKPDTIALEITSSMGVAEYRPGETSQSLIDRAMKVLQAAKSRQ